MLVAAGVLLAASAGVTIAERVAQEQVVNPLGLPGLGLQAARVVIPVALAFGVLVILLRWIPSAGPRLRDIWPAALAAAVALWALTLGFAFFVNNFGNYNVVYGSLAAVIIFLVYIYAAASLVFLAAAFAADRAEVFATRPQPGGPGFTSELRGFLRSLVVREPPSPSVDEDLQQDDQRPEAQVDPRDDGHPHQAEARAAGDQHAPDRQRHDAVDQGDPDGGRGADGSQPGQHQ